MTTIITLDQLSVRIGQKQVCADLSLTIGLGERWALLGINGIGKTTLLHTLAGLRPAQSGKVSLCGTALNDMSSRLRAQRIGLMSQDDEFSAETTVLDAALLGRLPHLSWWRGESAHDQQIAQQALRRVGLDQRFDHRLALSLSGGERRRVALASLLAQDASLLILDEPTTHLDMHQQIALLDLLAGLKDHTLIMSVHDINLATRYCTHALLVFGDGKCCGGPIGSMLNTAVLSTLYHHAIVSIDTPTGPIYLPA